MISLKSLALYGVRTLGGFALAQWLTRNRLRILCYHGFSIGDEYTVYPLMFMRGAVFERRMQILKNRKVPVISLGEGVKKLRNGAIKNAETVITLDDGWASNLTVGLPILKKFNYPACIYITTEHLAAGTEVFNVILGYMLLRTPRKTFTLSGIHPDIDGSYTIQQNCLATAGILVKAMEKAFNLSERQKRLKPIASALGFDLDEILRSERFRLVTPEEIAKLSENGVDIQLHSHTHRLPLESFQAVAYEINENRAAIKKMLDKEQNHFCYPSGVYGQQHPEWLASLGIVSATTCDPGFNSNRTSPLLLKRYLDRDDASDIEFEAEISGVRELARTVRHWLQARWLSRRVGALSQ